MQGFVARHEYRQAHAMLNSREIFGKFVHDWINNSYMLLTQRCRALEAAAPAVAGWQDFDIEGGPGPGRAGCSRWLVARAAAPLQVFGRPLYA
jgi:hypothetical protein